MLLDDDKWYAIETCRSSEKCFKKWFKINYIQLVHLLVVWWLVNLQDARCNNKGSELTIDIERASKKCRNDFNKFQKWDKEDVDKILTLLKDKNKDKKQAVELDFFFASTCESTKRLPRHLQLKVKAEIMKAVINSETECLDHEQFRIPTPSINCETAGCISRTTPSPVMPFYPSTGQNRAQ